MEVVAVGSVSECISDEIISSLSFSFIIIWSFLPVMNWKRLRSTFWCSASTMYVHGSIVSSGFIISLSFRGSYVFFSQLARPFSLPIQIHTTSKPKYKYIFTIPYSWRPLGSYCNMLFNLLTYKLNGWRKILMIIISNFCLSVSQCGWLLDSLTALPV